MQIKCRITTFLIVEKSKILINYLATLLSRIFAISHLDFRTSFNHTVWKLWNFSLTLFRQKFRESNGFTKQITIELIWRNIFSVRPNFSFSHSVNQQLKNTKWKKKSVKLIYVVLFQLISRNFQINWWFSLTFLQGPLLIFPDSHYWKHYYGSGKINGGPCTMFKQNLIVIHFHGKMKLTYDLRNRY